MSDETPQKQEILRNPDGTFPKGVSGNPGGVPRNSIKLRTRLKGLLADNPGLAEEAMQALIDGARSGDTSALKLLLDHHDGPLTIRVEGVSAEDIRSKFAAHLDAVKEIVPPEKWGRLAELARENLVDE